MGDPDQSGREQLRKMFEKYDSNGGNRLSVDELKRYIEAENCPAIEKDELTLMMQKSDANNDNVLDFEEFYTLNKTYLPQDFYRTICRAMVPTHVTESTGSEIEGEDAYELNRKLCPPSLVAVTFTVLQIIFYAVDHFKTKDDKSNLKHMGPLTTLFIFNPRLRHELWRFFTYMFVHSGFTHLFTNVVIQITLGLVLETVHRWWRVTLVYLAGVLAGSMGSSLFTPRISLHGSSAGGFALIAAQLATIIMNWREMEYGRTQLLVILSFLGLEYYFTDVKRISNIADVSGALAGFLIGIIVLQNIKELSWERKLKWYAIILYIILMGAGITFHLLLAYFE